MKTLMTLLAGSITLAATSPALAMNKNEPRFTRVIVDQLEADSYTHLTLTTILLV